MEFAFEYPEITKEWYSISNYLACLSVKDEKQLMFLIERALDKNIKISIFLEPDCDYEITSIALEPGEKSKKLCSGLPLALKRLKNVEK